MNLCWIPYPTAPLCAGYLLDWFFFLQEMKQQQIELYYPWFNWLIPTLTRWENPITGTIHMKYNIVEAQTVN